MTACLDTGCREIDRIEGVPIFEVVDEQGFLGLLDAVPSRKLRAFLDVDRDVFYAWNAQSYLHPDIYEFTGLFGVPVHLLRDRIHIRHHGAPDHVLTGMMAEICVTGVVRRIYSSLYFGEVPPLYSSHAQIIQNLDCIPMYRALERVGDGMPWQDDWVLYGPKADPEMGLGSSAGP
jgi:hypothetical protein